MQMRNSFSQIFPLLLWLSLPANSKADEGLWLFNRFPAERVKQAYGVEVSPEFLDRLRLSSVRLSSGGSGSFVSPQGLVLTNHHVASDCIQKLTTSEHNYMRDGFFAARLEEEKACPGLQADVLLGIEDVTAEVKAAAPAGASPEEVNRLRKAKMSQIEKACMDRTGNWCEVVTLYFGEEYHLYRYKRYDDVRLVFAPEESIAAFGGDPDNFTYPRYCLDFAFLRVYEHGHPASPPAYLRWSRKGARDGVLAFVSGHPGRTGRLYTYAALEFYRDVEYPLVIRRLESLVGTLLDFSAQSEDHKRVARDNLLGQQNSLKAYRGFLRGLEDAQLMARKRAEEEQLRQAVEKDPKLRAEFGSVWEEVAKAYAEFARFYPRYFLLERAATRGSELLRIARHVLRYAEEQRKPDGERLREYREAARQSLERELYSPAPISREMETAVLADYLKFLVREFGSGDPLVRQLLAGQQPEAAAASYVNRTQLDRVEERRRLVQDLQALHASQDGMIVFARLLDPEARRWRKEYEDRVESVLLTSAARIARARFAIYGPTSYPDATFTLRLAYGPVRGYVNEQGQPVPWATTFRGLYQRATGQEPYQLPQSWLRARSKLNLNTPFNFVTTCDIHGGNSGSPTVDPAGELIGVVFDGNLESLPNNFVYTDERARAVHVAVQAIEESLRKVYGAGRLLKELGLQ